MKRRLSAVIAFAMILSMTACSTNQQVQTPTQGETQEQESTKEQDSSEEQTAEAKPYIEIPKEYQGWDDAGNSVDFPRAATAENGMVSSMAYESSKVGADIMKAGGNAIDAAVATAFSQFVVLPAASGIGGGGFMTYYCAETGETVFLSFREVAPMFQTAEMWVQDEDGNVVGNHNKFGGLASGVPGEVDGLCYMLEKWGTMSLAEVIQPAIDIAYGGFTMSAATQARINEFYDVFTQNEECASIYLNPETGLVRQVGETLYNIPLAKALEKIRDQGKDVVYKGEIGQAMVNVTQDHGGVMTMKDLENYHCWEDEPASNTYRGYQIYSANFPSSGGAYVIETLNILEQLPVYEYDSEEYWHQLAEVQKMVWVDRAKYAGDTRFVDVPVEGITSKEYAKTWADQLDMTQVQDFNHGDPWKYNTKESKETTSFSVCDKEGNMVSITHTLNNGFGNKIYVDGYGFFMNNQLNDFVVGNGYANSLEPGKCPLSSMSPSVILDPDGKPFMAVGAPGGISILPSVAQVIMNVIDYNMSIDEAVNAKRIYSYPTGLEYNQSVDEDMRKMLTDLGYEDAGLAEAIPAAIMYMPDGTLQGSVESDFYTYGVYTNGVAVGY